MNRIIISLLLLVFSGLFLTTPAQAIEPIPKESGISGFVNLGAGGLSVKNNMVAAAGPVDIGKKRIDSIFDSPDAESSLIPVIDFELAYTFGSSRTQLYLGNRLEDFIRFDSTTLAGIRQELPDESALAVSYVFSGVPTEVWADPYVVNRDRVETDRTSSGVRLEYDNILGSDFEIQLTWRKIELDDELSGLTPAGLGGRGLLPAQAKLLDREGDSYQFQVLYPFRLEEGKHILAPAFIYTRLDLDGGAMAYDRYEGQLTYFYTGEIFNVASNLILGFADYDDTNPIYLKKREDDIYGASLAVFYKNLLDVKRLNLVGTVAGVKSDANINFYDATIGFISLSALYRF